jgi:excisionase family DNA binding protein
MAEMTVRELASQLGLDPKYLRQLIRQHGLVPAHRRGEHYTLGDEDQARIKDHPGVRRAIETRRRRMG